jgi:glutaredoxin
MPVICSASRCVHKARGFLTLSNTASKPILAKRICSRSRTQISKYIEFNRVREHHTPGIHVRCSHQDMGGLGSRQDHAVAVVTTVGCPYCKKVKDVLNQTGIEYIDVNMTDRGQYLQACKELTGWGTVPLVFVGGSFVGGASETIELIQNGTFHSMVESTGGYSTYDSKLSDALFSSVAASASVSASATEYFETALGLREIQKEYLHSIGSNVNTHVDIEDLRKYSADDPLVVERMLKHKVVIQQAPGKFVWSSGIPIIAGKVSKTPLNGHFHVQNEAKNVDAVATSEMLRFLALILYDEYMSPDGSKVDYIGLVKDPRFRIYVDATTELQSVNLSGLKSSEDRMCFWINMYNALIVHALAVFGPATSTLQRLTWFSDVSYTIGGYRFSANDIEHGILRGNAPSPASLWNILGLSTFAQPTFPSGDPRKQFALARVDPRIHFALNCGAKSCPPIKVYSPDTLEQGLSSSAEAFCNSEVAFDPSSNTLLASSILKWYGVDFGATQKERIQYLLPYLSEETRNELEQIPEENLDSIQMKYKEYDWSTNSY